MRSLLCILAGLFLISCAVSCKKNNSSPGGGSVQGNWLFLFLKAQTQSTIATGTGETDVTKSSFTTTGNSGTIAFTADSMVSNGLAYSANFLATDYLYFGGSIYDSISMPFSESIPPTSESVACKQIGNDSLYFPGGGFTSPASGGSGSQASGARYVIDKDTLKINVQASETVSGGLETLNETVYLLKQ